MTDKEREETILTIASDQNLFSDGECELAEPVVISEGEDNGAYVQAWVWVSFADTSLDKDWDGPVDSDGAPCQFINHYTCPRCNNQWQDQWSSMCDDDCGKCGLRHITPTHSEDA